MQEVSTLTKSARTGIIPILLGVSLLCAMAAGADPFASPLDRAKWKSFGVEDWMDFDPFERALPSRNRPQTSEWQRKSGQSRTDQLKSLIAFAEAGPKGYDAIHHSARNLPRKAPTQMTLREIDRWTRATPKQPHAIGRYQFIPSTLRSLQRRAGLSPNIRFSPQVQDQLADLLLRDAGYEAFLQGRLGRRRFMNNLALIWAGLPRSNGKSAYHGYAGNRATVSIAFYQNEMAKIFGS